GARRAARPERRATLRRRGASSPVMRRFLLPLLLVGGRAAAQAAPAASLPFDTLLARRYVEEARALTARDGGALWGRSLDGPLLFVEPKSRALLSALPAPDGGLAALGAWYTGTLPPSEN